MVAEHAVQSFNSKLVRLEVETKVGECYLNERFNSKLVRLEGVETYQALRPWWCFNSKLVRLEAYPNIALI